TSPIAAPILTSPDAIIRLTLRAALKPMKNGQLLIRFLSIRITQQYRRPQQQAA
ncbi:MAG: hypothetical protein ACI92S_003070, partial [Planctomycetaceae bacterium]